MPLMTMSLARRRFLNVSLTGLLGVVAAYASLATEAGAGMPGTPSAPAPDNAAEGTDVGKAVVELDVYSGRPNPVWRLSAEQTGTVLGMLHALAPAPLRATPDGLGYRGVLVTVADPATGAPLRAKVFDGLVRTGTEADGTYLADPGRRVEQFLVETGRSHIDESLYVLVAREASSAGSQD